jgi:hypothetical protein
MYIGMLYNIFICLISGLGGIIVFILLQRLRRKEKREYSEMLDYTVLAFGLLWLFSALRTSFLWFGRPDLDLFIWTWFVNPMMYAHFALFFFYNSWALFKNKKIRLVFNGIFVLIVLASLSTFLKYKPLPGKITYWGTEPIISTLTNIFHIYLIFLPIFILILIGFLKQLRIWIKTKNPIHAQLLGIHGSIIAYGSIAAFDALSFLQSWILILIRIGIMVCVFSIYLFATSDTRQ